MHYELRPPLNEHESAELEGLRSLTNIANRIASLRIRMKLTQEELGRRAGTKQSRISELESLRGNPRLDTLDRIAKELGLMVDLVPRPTTIVTASVPGRAKGHRVFERTDDDTGVYSISALSHGTSESRGAYEPIG